MPAAIDEQIIFNAALKIVTERGYIGATTKLIARQAGIGEVTLFRRFGNKDTVILEALKREAAKLDGEASLYTGQLEADLTRILTAYQFLLQTRAPLMLTFYIEISRHPELAAVLEYPQRIVRKILELLERYQSEGRLSKKEPAHQLAELFGPIMMMTLFEVVYAESRPINLQSHLAGFLKGNGL